VIKLLLLDWNGTLFDDREVVYGSVAEIFRRFNLSPPLPDIYFREITAQFMDFYFAHGIPIEATPEALNDIRHEYFLVHWQEGKLRLGARELLMFARNRGLRTIIASAEVNKILQQRVYALNIRQLLSFVHGGLKNKTNDLKRIVAGANIKPEQAIYVDDTKDGITSAKSAGLKTIGFTNGYNSHGQIGSASPTHFAHSLWDVIGILEEKELN